MTKTKILSVVIVLLMLLNIGLVWQLMHNRPHPKKFVGPKNLVIEKLKLDEQQVAAYEILITKHFDEILELEKSQNQKRKSLYNLLLQNDVEQQNALISELGEVQAEIESTHFKHFVEIKALCREDQLPAFEALSKELARLFNNKPGPKKRP